MDKAISVSLSCWVHLDRQGDTTMPILVLSRQVGTITRWELINWTQPGLPDSNFRVSLRGATREYRPQAINAGQQRIRARMMGLLTSGPLTAGLAEICRRTRIPPNYEFSGYIFGNGSIPRVYTDRDRGAASVPPVPTGTVIGYAHSHPTPEELFAPPSAGDYDSLSFPQYPIQLVVEMHGRTWGQFNGRLCTWLGTINSTGVFQPQTHQPTNQRVYQVISYDQLLLERG